MKEKYVDGRVSIIDNFNEEVFIVTLQDRAGVEGLDRVHVHFMDIDPEGVSHGCEVFDRMGVRIFKYPFERPVNELLPEIMPDHMLTEDILLEAISVINIKDEDSLYKIIEVEDLEDALDTLNTNLYPPGPELPEWDDDEYNAIDPDDEDALLTYANTHKPKDTTPDPSNGGTGEEGDTP